MEPPKKITFQPEFFNEICTIYVWVIKKKHNSEKKNKMLYRFKIGEHE